MPSAKPALHTCVNWLYLLIDLWTFVLFIHVDTLNVKNAKTLNCIRFFDNYIIQKHTQSSLFRSVYVFASLTVTVIYNTRQHLVSVKSPVDHCCTLWCSIHDWGIYIYMCLSSLSIYNYNIIRNTSTVCWTMNFKFCFHFYLIQNRKASPAGNVKNVL